MTFVNVFVVVVDEQQPGRAVGFGAGSRGEWVHRVPREARLNQSQLMPGPAVEESRFVRAIADTLRMRAGRRNVAP